MTAVLSLCALACKGQDAESSTNSMPERVPPRQQVASPSGYQGGQQPQAKPRAHVNRLYLLEERLNRSFKNLLPRSTIADGMPVAPPPRPVVRINPNRGQNDRDRDLMISRPDDFLEQETARQMGDPLEFRRSRDPMNPDQDLRGSRSRPEERWLRDMNENSRGTAGLRSSGSEEPYKNGFQFGQDRRDSAPDNVSRSEANLRNILQSGSPLRSSLNLPEERQNSSFSSYDPFGRKEQDSYLEQYRRLLNPQLAAPQQGDLISTALGSTPTDPARSLRSTGLDPFNSGPSQNNSMFSQPFGANANPVLSPRAPMDTTERVLNQWNQYYTPPRVEAPRSNIPERPTFEAPRRKF